jgi:hypothetical protein
LARPSPLVPAQENSLSFRSNDSGWFLFLVKEPTFTNQRTKKMNSENFKKIANQAIGQLVETLNAGHSEALTRYLTAATRRLTSFFARASA